MNQNDFSAFLVSAVRRVGGRVVLQKLHRVFKTHTGVLEKLSPATTRIPQEVFQRVPEDAAGYLRGGFLVSEADAEIQALGPRK